MGVEQDGLGVGEIVSVFYEVEAQAFVAQGNSRRAQVGAGAMTRCLLAVLRLFITMKLDCSPRYHCTGSYDFNSRCIDEQKNRSHKRGQSFGEFCRSLDGYSAGARGIQYEADGISARRNGRIDVLLPGQSANLDSGACVHGKASYAGVRSGMPQWESYRGPRK